MSRIVLGVYRPFHPKAFSLASRPEPKVRSTALIYSKRTCNAIRETLLSKTVNKITARLSS